jgi:hypothetical protein
VSGTVKTCEVAPHVDVKVIDRSLDLHLQWSMTSNPACSNTVGLTRLCLWIVLTFTFLKFCPLCTKKNKNC